MMYFKPLGGLCNRLRAIDSMLSWCKKYKTDLTVIWVKDSSLNCSFKEIFEIPNFPDFDFRIIDCPVGYPEMYPRPIKMLKPNRDSEQNGNHTLFRSLKNMLKGRFLNNEQRKIRNVIHALEENAILTNVELASIYDSQSHVQNKSTSEMDKLFFPLIKPRIEKLMEFGGNVYISSCYRFFPIENAYASFKPLVDIQSKVDNITKNFEDTVGLHIRRSDHSSSKAFSTTERFVDVVEKNIKENANATFFLSTDDAITKGELVRKYGNIIITNTVSSYDRNKKDAVKDALIDLYCLSRTEKIYGSHHSSFSQTAADIGLISETTVK